MVHYLCFTIMIWDFEQPNEPA